MTVKELRDKLAEFPDDYPAHSNLNGCFGASEEVSILRISEYHKPPFAKYDPESGVFKNQVTPAILMVKIE